ncbi:MAG: MOSC domain-containing protein [Methylobacter sp.]|nr:MAG: MOSC domain-containing protein [Methylobacter sp.]PPD23594.1 MAG: MOSC domain-containing protein [Methylobacter sp.]
MLATITLTGLFIYPVKSLAGIQVEQWPVADTGFLYDRKWMLIDSDGNFLSQRKLPRMALIKTAIHQDRLRLSAAGMPAFDIALEPADGKLIPSTVWQDQCHARQVSKEADQWFSDFLQQPCQLVYKPDDVIRQVDSRYARLTDQTAFSDGFPFLIISEASLHALNTAMGIRLSMARFRPNLVIAGCADYAEDSWREIRIGDIDFRLPKPCSRCAITTIDTETAETGKEPLSTLSRTRKWQNAVYFGQNALHNQTGILTVNDEVTIHSFGPAQPPLSVN